ncbi:MAG: tRNA lysidine(34) synthetase TilS [Eubacteriales bacterium]|nr:tRNA lysidine(34) synthetase TilS [Eubacteriales bacterium]
MKRIIDFIEKQSMLSKGGRILCAVSGGADSMCLLSLLKSMEGTLDIRVSAAHYEHGIRGEESLRDLRFVKEYCENSGIPFVFEQGNVPEYAARNGLGTEEAARLLRYDFLERARVQMNCDVIATAHNMDDNAETVVFNLLRGSGTAGLSGIPPVRDNIIRPLLCMPRSEIEKYLEDNGIPHVEDSTNLSEDYSRNRIRHNVIPELKKIFPSASEAIFRASLILREDDSCLSGQADAFISGYLKKYSGGCSVPSDKLSELPEAVSSRVVRKLAGRSLTYEQTDAVLKLAGSTERKMADLPGVRVTAEQGRIWFPAADSGTSPLPETKGIAEPVRLPVGQTVKLAGTGLKIVCDKCVYHSDVHDLLNTLYLKCGEIYGHVSCTSRLPGDRLRVKGRGCTKTLKSLFMEAKMTGKERDEALVFRDDKGILAVAGLAVSERAAPAEGDEVLKITIIREKEE